MNNFDNAMEIIGQSLFNNYQEEIPREVTDLLDIINNAYVLVDWPNSQIYMEKEWFEEEAVLHLNLSSAYFIPIKRLL